MSRAVWGALHILFASAVPQIACSQPKAISASDREMLQGWSNGRYLAPTHWWENRGRACQALLPHPTLWGSESQNHWVRKDLKAHPVPPLCHELGATHQFRLSGASSNPALGTSSDVAPTALWAPEPEPHLPLSKEFQTAHNSQCQHSCHHECPTTNRGCLSVPVPCPGVSPPTGLSVTPPPAPTCGIITPHELLTVTWSSMLEPHSCCSREHMHRC